MLKNPRKPGGGATEVFLGGEYFHVLLRLAVSSSSEEGVGQDFIKTETKDVSAETKTALS